MAASDVNSQLPLVVIVGPTASGKTSLAVRLAKEYGGEIICADSRTIYKDMNIGTAKPTKEEQKTVPHWGIDLVAPGERFTAANFKQYATQKIYEIRERGHVPFLVGGTGLYVDSVILDYQFSDGESLTHREHLGGKTIDELILYCKINNIELPENIRNKRYLIRAIEQKGINRKRSTSIMPDCIVVGITTEKDVLYNRIKDRSEQIFKKGVVEEAIVLGKKYGWQSEAMTANIYPLLHRYIDGEISGEDLKNEFITLDRKLAKRQLTWFKRRNFIHWLSLADAYAYLADHLAIE